MKINWDTVITNVISTFFAAIIIAAAAIIWNGATTVDEKVNEAKINSNELPRH